MINNVVYIGEIDLYNKTNHLIVNGGKTEAPSVVSMIYEMSGEPYFATLKGALSEQEAYYQIESGKINSTGSNKIFLFQ